MELSPCPFCGHTGPIFDPDTESVMCQSCTATGPIVGSHCSDECDTDEEIEAKAGELWNTRKSFLSVVPNA